MTQKCPIRPKYNGKDFTDYTCYKCHGIWLDENPVLPKPTNNSDGHYCIYVASPEIFPPNNCMICSEQYYQTGSFNHCDDISSWIRGEKKIKRFWGGCTDECPKNCISLHLDCAHLRSCNNTECDCKITGMWMTEIQHYRPKAHT